MKEVTWRCERPSDGDVKMAAKPEHKSRLEEEGYVCEVYVEESWTSANRDTS